MTKTTLLRKRSWIKSRWVLLPLVLVLAGAAIVYAVQARKPVALASMPGVVTVNRGPLVANVTGGGTVAAERTLNLAFQNAGTVSELYVRAGDAVKTDQVVARQDDRNLKIQLTNAEAGLASAQARLIQSQQGNSRAVDVAAAQAAVKSAQAAYDAAVRSAGTTESQLAASAAAFQKAQVGLEEAQSAFDQVAWRTDIGMLPQSRSLQKASIDYNQAKSNYDALKSTLDTDAASKIESAMSQLVQAKANLAKLTAPATDTDLAIQQASVVQAEQTLKQAQLSLDAAALKAPFAGVVSLVNMTQGSSAAAGATVATLIDRSTLHIDLRLNESDVVRVQMAQPVTITIDSLVGWQARGQVAYIAPAAEVINGVVTYLIRVNLPDDDPRVKVGMTTNVAITTDRRDSVLLVPNSALLPKSAGRVVQVPSLDGKDPQEVDVETGLTDGAQTEIISGLTEGQPIVAAPQPKRKGGLLGGG